MDEKKPALPDPRIEKITVREMRIAEMFEEKESYAFEILMKETGLTRSELRTSLKKLEEIKTIEKIKKTNPSIYQYNAGCDLLARRHR